MKRLGATLFKNNIWLIIISSLFLFNCGQEPDDQALGKANLILDPIAKAIVVDGTFSYNAKFTNARGEELSNILVEWVSSDPSIATVSDAGEVLGVGDGQVEISASVTTANAGLTNSNTVILTVLAAETDATTAVAMVVISSSQTAYFVDDSIELMATVSTIDGDPISDREITWASDNPEVATVDDTGMVQILSAGTVNMTATVDGINSPMFTLITRVPNMNRVATFQGVGGHRVTGTATLQVNSEGKLEVIFSNDFTITNGPKLEVFLANSGTPNTTSTNIGALQSTSKTQTYSVPDNVMIADFNWVIVHCQPFNIVFARAELQPLP